MIPIIDTGHGYETPGKESTGFNWPNGKVKLKENSVNEAVGNKLSYLFWANGKEAYFITNEWYDVPLEERCRREREIAADIFVRGKKSVFISIHADAFRVKDQAKGGRFFYYSNSGKEIADKLTAHLKSNGYPLELRPPAAANFHVLRETYSPAVLFEMGFMTTSSDLEKLLDDKFRNQTALCLFNALNSLS
ncbi:N-acetylmuramoyl-L-alanine amidase [Aegicerativicinus sediminis]|uniref:N-acetylmuramoyl-L-alanine amidase n=1 Tax=Aegicerativicinus sediminis TaxID=2893202 RepID=UPI001E306304|nr:N-acetylmuramoyl-L-alanine amidase [Aegicerativicinus sediminis]